MNYTNTIPERISEVGLGYMIFLFFGVFLLSLSLIPKIRAVALKSNHSDAPDHRSSHSSPVPTFGGITFFISYLLVLFFVQTIDDTHTSLTLIASISIIFLTGFLDDLKNLSPRIKFLGQFVGVAILMFRPEFRILSLHGFMGVFEIPLYASIGGSLFFLLGLINAFNLIDGIDGLTGITGIIVASFYSYMLYQLEYYFYLSISVATIGTLLAFLRFNFSVSKKIFMGDTGSLVIGLVLGLLTLKFMAMEDAAYSVLSFKPQQLPLFLVGVLFVPILDILRVMFLRAVKGVSMFKPDRNHIHHIVIDFGLSHRKASCFIGAVNFTVALIMFVVIQNFSVIQSSCILLFMFLMAILLLFLMNKNRACLKLKSKIKQSMLKMFF